MISSLLIKSRLIQIKDEKVRDSEKIQRTYLEIKERFSVYLKEISKREEREKDNSYGEEEGIWI